MTKSPVKGSMPVGYRGIVRHHDFPVPRGLGREP